MKKYYNIELDKEPAMEFIQQLKIVNIKYEISDCYNVKHIEVWADELEVKFCNDILDIIL